MCNNYCENYPSCLCGEIESHERPDVEEVCEHCNGTGMIDIWECPYCKDDEEMLFI